MSKPLRIVLWTLGIIFGVTGFVFAWPSLLGCLMALLLIFAIADFSSRRYRQTVRSFNFALRAVCRHDGAIGKVALAFSRSGPISGPCYEYARRLMMGEDPIDAAVEARVPLQLQTAVAMLSPGSEVPGQSSSDQLDDGDDPELAMVDATMMPAYAQFIYLSATALVTCVVLGFMGIFIVPTLEAMTEEFGLAVPHRWLFTSAPALWILFLLAFLVAIVAPTLNRGHLLGLRLPNWVPLMPRPAERKAEILRGLADGIDAGWPLGRALATGHAVSIRWHDRQLFERAMRMVEAGAEPVEAIHRVGWIDANERSWLGGASPRRMAELLRTIGAQDIRDARSNLRWIMAVVYPVLILLLGCSVLAYAYGFFSSLLGLISGLS